ncbi:MAG: hypothetical protein NZO41_00225 [Candidatus Bipolaricaulota bacterium]|nr:hypothetical protein [Candidatus Bipolaricaulota bacterium]MDW8140734.1 hypothetical protein [Candidatus Bipolaricaulota bacterium]
MGKHPEAKRTISESNCSPPSLSAAWMGLEQLWPSGSRTSNSGQGIVAQTAISVTLRYY